MFLELLEKRPRLNLPHGSVQPISIAEFLTKIEIETRREFNSYPVPQEIIQKILRENPGEIVKSLLKNLTCKVIKGSNEQEVLHKASVKHAQEFGQAKNLVIVHDKIFGFLEERDFKIHFSATHQGEVLQAVVCYQPKRNLLFRVS